jgi:hypothetical protein
MSQVPNNMRSNVKQRSAVGVGALSISFGIYQLGIGFRQRNMRRVEAGFEAIGGGFSILESGIVKGDETRWSEIGAQVGAFMDILSRTRQMGARGGRKQRGLGGRQQRGDGDD